MDLLIRENNEKIKDLLNENINLRYKKNLLYADKIYDDVINIGSKNKPIYKNVKKMVWKEASTDEGTGEVVFIDRGEIIEVEGEKSDGWEIIKYYTTDDI